MLRLFSIVILSFVFALGCTSDDSDSDSDNDNLDIKASPLKFKQSKARYIDYKDYYEISIPFHWKVMPLPNLKNAFNLYPDKKIKHLYNNCTLQVVADLYEIVPTQKRFEILLNETYLRSRTFIKSTTISEKDLAVSSQKAIKFNNLKGASFNISSVNKNRFFESTHYLLVNPDDIGVVYASAVALKKETASECLKESEKALSSLKYAPKKETY